MKNQLRTNSYSGNQSDVLKSSPVGANEVVKHDGRLSGSVFLPDTLADRQKNENREVHSAHVTRSRKHALSLAPHAVAPMHSLQTLSRSRNGLRWSVMRGGREGKW